MNTAGTIFVLQTKDFQEAGLPVPRNGKDAILTYCERNGIPIQDVLSYGKGRAPVITRTDWDLHVLRTKAPGPLAAAAGEDYAAILRRLARIEELQELILGTLTDPKGRAP